MTLKYLLLAAYFGGILLYGLLNTRKDAPYDFRTVLDRYIPLVPVFIVPYLGIFILVPVAVVFIFETPFAVAYLLSLVIGMYGAAVGWYLFPARMYRQTIVERNIFDRLVALLYHDDPHANGFPSSHVINSVITSFSMSLAFPHLAVLWWTIGATVALSTIFVKQHRVIDVIGGIVWAGISILLAGYLIG